MPILPETIQQDQMPQEAPQYAPPVSPVPMPQMLGTQMSPYIGTPYQQVPSSPSVLDTPQITQALRDQTLAQIQKLGASGNDKRDKIRNIFTGIMAPAMAIFGGAGGAAAGADMVQQARQSAMMGKQQKQSEQQQAAQTLKGLVDIENTIRLKPLGMMLNDQRKQQQLAIAGQAEQRKYQQGNTRLQIQDSRNRIMDDHYKQIGALQSRGLDIKTRGLEQTKSLADQRDHTLRDIAVLNAQQRQGTASQSNATRLQALTQQWQMQNAKLQTDVEQQNQEIRAKIDEHNNQVRQKGTGELLHADQYMLNFNGVDPMPKQEEPDDSDYQAALQAVMQPQGQQQAQPGQAPIAPPQQNAQAPQQPGQPQQHAPMFNGRAVNPTQQQNLLMMLQQRNGMNFQQASDYLRTKGLM